MYNFIIRLYACFVRLVSPFHKKAKQMVCGQKNTYRILGEKIDPHAKHIWVHCASLGEFEQARPMIETLKKEHPEYRIVLTFFSPSGYEVRKEYSYADVVCYLPFDTPKKVTAFLDLVKPTLAIFVKYEFWYNYIHEAYLRGIPVYLISAIFRDNQLFFKKKAGRYGKILHFYREIFVQDEHSKELLNRHGITRVTVTGDTRFDRVIEIRRQAKELPLVHAFTADKESNGEMVLVAGSSWPPDEDIFIDYFNTRPRLKLIIAPHEIHESHLEEIEKKLKRPYIRYSAATEENIRDRDCLIVDCFGLLSSIYRYGDIAYIGGGFGVGIHNLPEAAVYGIPVIFGPNYRKFREAHDLIEKGGGFVVHDKKEFNELMDRFAERPEALSTAGDNAEDYILSNAGATRQIMEKMAADL
ncbi:MAG: glycosyltransferase N-terminal domain-containing protein [Dysgonamonadaceae bacterium]|nr:glycosyltransferase N-terminal domain-containing protein [Dysgonamonadaceae bacterium]